LSRGRGEAFAHEVRDEFGEVSPVRPCAGRVGTEVEVADLFRNVPARAKFLKSVGAEMARITEAVHRFGISTPDVEFRLTHAGRAVAHFPKEMAVRERIARAYGRDLVDELIEARAEGDDVVLTGFLAPPSRTYADTTRMLFFLNGRHVRDRTLMHAVRQAYEDLVFGPRHPMVFLHLTVDPRIVDQNVHPAKHEVRFRNAGLVHGLVHGALREALTRADLAHPVRIDGPREEGDREGRVKEAVADYLARSQDRPEGALFPPGRPGGGRPAAGGDVGRALDFLQVRDTYIVLETSDGIAILDQHALHERVLYDRIKDRYLAGEVEVQRFLRPALVDLSPVEIETLLADREALAAVGVLVEPFGKDSVAVHGLPAQVSGADPASILEGILARAEEEKPAGREDLAERMLSTLACRAAVKAGDRLSRDQVADLLEAAESLTHAHTCPHGRPTELRISYASLEKHFHRK
ncbi:MAG: DNA mismatch repair endonuclease MutL, partial [Planctomycetota bacterium]